MLGNVRALHHATGMSIRSFKLLITKFGGLSREYSVNEKGIDQNHRNGDRNANRSKTKRLSRGCGIPDRHLIDHDIRIDAIGQSQCRHQTDYDK